MGIEIVSTGISNSQKRYVDFPVKQKTIDGVDYILETTRIGEDLIFLLDGEKIGIITYEMNRERNTCYISFFGTQNGEANIYDYKKLLHLDVTPPGEQSKKHISYAMMQYFIENICHPNNIDRIYLDPDDSGKKIFWKDKIGNHFIDNGMFTRVSSSGFEVCFTLSSKK